MDELTTIVGSITVDYNQQITRVINFEPCRFVDPFHEWPHGRRQDGSGGMPHCCSEPKGHNGQHKCFCGFICDFNNGEEWMTQDAMMIIMGR